MKKEKMTEKVEKETDVISNDKEKTTQKPKSLIIQVENLVPFENHPYKVIDNEDMNDLIDSIREHGILNPLIVRPLDEADGKYEIISGHRRFHAAQKLEMKKLPCTVHFVDRDAATVMMVDSNCQRTEVLPSEKAWAYKMKLDAIKRMPGRKPAENGDPVGPDLRSSEKLAEESDDSPTQIKRYIRLSYLVPELLQFVDEGKIAMRPAVEMSYLPEEVQRDIVDRIDESGGEVFPSHAQTRRIREKTVNGGKITYAEIKAIMDEPKPNQAEKVSIKRSDLTKYFPSSYTPEQIIKSILNILEIQSQQRKERRRDDGMSR